MKIKSTKKVLQTAQILVVVAVLFFAFRELFKIFIDMDKSLFKLYSDKLTLKNIIIIFILGIVSYIPLSFYDLIIKNKVGINLPTKKVYQYSWIATSISSIVGFGGSSAIFLKNLLYKNHIKDEKKLFKEVSKIVGLNLSGFSLVCLSYSIWNIIINKKFDIVFIASIILGLYLPGIIIYFTYKLFKNRDKEEYFMTLKIIGTSILEWITTILLIYGLMKILEINVGFVQFVPIYVTAIIVSMISMAPSGIGTFDLTLINGLQKVNIPSEKVLLLIILYRISYYIVPLMIGIFLYIADIYNKLNIEARELVSRIISKLFHIILICTTFITGIYLIFMRNIDIERFISNKNLLQKVDTFEISTMISIILGFILIVISTMLYSKAKKVYYALIAGFGIVTLLLLISNHGVMKYALIIVMSIIILLSKKSFYREGFIITLKDSIKTISLILLIVIIKLIAL
ncbi:MAG: lysylphosphatidylglycerol synthase domain-containing protein [Clostridium sp.]|nr:lysylphosphatidylglycerol synthase domain-containing protein [Clostridium sp.]